MLVHSCTTRCGITRVRPEEDIQYGRGSLDPSPNLAWPRAAPSLQRLQPDGLLILSIFVFFVEDPELSVKALGVAVTILLWRVLSPTRLGMVSRHCPDRRPDFPKRSGRTTMAGDDISMESSELKRQKMDSDDGRDVITEERIRLRDGSRAQQEEISRG
ncbi:hypothetical protein NL676_017219 [Syzygium grande]|nr:hypothetical protein NL676_017219 [Syzygium grande]